MRVLHSAALLRPPSGILNQMAWEQKAAHMLGLEWKTRMFCPAKCTEQSETICFSCKVSNNQKKTNKKGVIDWLSFRREYYQWLKSQEDDVDIFVLRHYVHDPFQLFFIKNSRKPVCLVHHTKEIAELAMLGGFFGKFRAVLETIIGKSSIINSNIIIGVTKEIISYELLRSGQNNKENILYPNGIFFSNDVVKDKRKDVPELLFVAGLFSPWHGLDLLLEEMKQNESDFLLHLVGSLSERDKYLASQDKRVILHGRKTQAEIEVIAESCWLGLSSFALYRNNMEEACTLKVREYLMMGLPVYAGYKDTFPEDFRYYLKGNLDINGMLNYAQKNLTIPRKVIAQSSLRYIDKVVLLHSLQNKLSEFL